MSDAADITQNTVTDAMRDLGLSAQTAQVLAAGAPCVRFKLSDALSGCRLGGAPDLPRDVAWPCDTHDTPLPFVLSLDLRLIRGALVLEPLPATGYLLVFVDCEMENGEVVYAEESGAPAAFPAQLPSERRYAVQGLQPVTSFSMPESVIDELNISEQLGDELDSRIVPEDPSVQIGGYATRVGRVDVEDEERFLLAQIPTGDGIADNWDGAIIYVWISKEDLAQRDFTNVEFTCAGY